MVSNVFTSPCDCFVGVFAFDLCMCFADILWVLVCIVKVVHYVVMMGMRLAYHLLLV